MIVVGAGLAGLACARDLIASGLDVVVLEARHRPGGRVEQQALPDGRIVQLGGEVVGPSHTAYLSLVAELGLNLEPAFPDRPGSDTWAMADGVHLGHGLDVPWFTAADRISYATCEQAFGELIATIDPGDPWSHPNAAALDACSVGDFLRANGATPNVVRMRDVSMLALAAESVERTSLLSDLRKEAAVGSRTFYSYDTWECLKVTEGSATVAWRLAEQVGSARIRYASPVSEVQITPSASTVVLNTGETLTATTVVCAIPAGPLRNVRITGVSAARLGSLHAPSHPPTLEAPRRLALPSEGLLMPQLPQRE